MINRATTRMTVHNSVASELSRAACIMSRPTVADPLSARFKPLGTVPSSYRDLPLPRRIVSSIRSISGMLSWSKNSVSRSMTTMVAVPSALLRIFSQPGELNVLIFWPISSTGSSAGSPAASGSVSASTGTGSGSLDTAPGGFGMPTSRNTSSSRGFNVSVMNSRSRSSSSLLRRTTTTMLLAYSVFQALL